MNLLTAKAFSTAVMKVNYPVHQGKPNAFHGKFYFVGSVPSACYDYDRGSSKFYDSEQNAIDAAIAAGAPRIQRLDCSLV